MKNTSFIKTLVAVLVAASATIPAYAAVNPWDTLEGSVGLKGLGTVKGISYADVKVAAKLTDQAVGAEYVPPASGKSVYVAGNMNKAAKYTNKEVLASAGITDPTGWKIRWCSVDGQTYLQAYQGKATDPTKVQLIQPKYLQLYPEWILTGEGVYKGTATLTATKVVSGTSVYIAEGKLDGLTPVYGIVGDYLGFSGVGKFKGDARKGWSTSSVKVAGSGKTPPATK